MLLKRSSRRNTISDKTGYDCKQLIQNLVTDIEQTFFAASLVMSSMNSSCTVPGTSSTLMVNELLANANGVPVLQKTGYDFTKYVIS